MSATYDPAEDLEPFLEVAAGCNEEECIEIMDDCLESDLPFVRGPVRDLYGRRLETLQRRDAEITHYEELYD